MIRCLAIISVFVLLLLSGPASSFADQKWTESKPGQQAKDFSLYKDGSVAVNQTRAFKFSQFETMMLTFSPSGKYAIALGWTEKGGFEGYVLDIKSRRVIANTKETGLLNRGSWSFDEKFMLLRLGGEGIGELLCFSLQKRTVNKLPFKDMSKTTT
jgi:hypothetical protein